MEEARKLKSIGSYALYDVIGEGSFSIVRKAILNNGSNEIFACKIIPKIRLKERNLATRFQYEIRVMQALHHPNIVQIFDIFRDKQFYYVIMEYVSGGTLYDYVVDNRRISEDQSRFFMYQIFNAMKYIHNFGICHRDMKLENILLAEDNSDIKISDFGLSKFLDKDGLTKTPVGSPLYASPECLSGQPYDARKSDLWSCGVIMYVLLSGKMPWSGKTQSHIYSQIKKANYEMPSYFSSTCKKLIRSILTNDVGKRLTDKEILDSEWFSEEKERLETQLYLLKPNKLLSLKRLDCFFQRDLKSRISSSSFECLLSSIHENEGKLYPKSTQNFNEKMPKLEISNSNKADKVKTKNSTIRLRKIPSTTSIDVDFDKKLHSILLDKENDRAIFKKKLCTSLHPENKIKLRHRPSSLCNKQFNHNKEEIIQVDYMIPDDKTEINDNSISHEQSHKHPKLRSRNRCNSHSLITIHNLSSSHASTSDNFVDDTSSRELSSTRMKNEMRENNSESTSKSISYSEDNGYLVEDKIQNNEIIEKEINIENKELSNENKESNNEGKETKNTEKKKKKRKKDKKEKRELKDKNEKKDKKEKKDKRRKTIKQIQTF